jgi:hypothetical protein
MVMRNGRRGPTRDVEAGTCACGSEWFSLVGSEDRPHGAVAIDERGIVRAYAGTPHCLECGEAYVAPRDRLQVVD